MQATAPSSASENAANLAFKAAKDTGHVVLHFAVRRARSLHGELADRVPWALYIHAG